MQNNTLNERQLDALKNIRNHLVHNGSMPSIRELMRQMDYKSPRSAVLVIDSLVKQGYLKKVSGGYRLLKDIPSSTSSASTIRVPLVGSAACGVPIFAEENIEGYFQVSTTLANPSNKYFILRAEGDSMNLAGINDGELVLVQQQSAADNGERVVALIDGEATIKNLQKGSDTIALLPKSSNPLHQPIILSEDFLVQGRIVCTLPTI